MMNKRGKVCCYPSTRSKMKENIASSTLFCVNASPDSVLCIVIVLPPCGEIGLKN
jgi:hypothetical protein